MLALDSRRGRYRKLVVATTDRLAGAILLGDLRDARALRELLAAAASAVPSALLDGFADAPASTATRARDADPGRRSAPATPSRAATIVHAIATGGLERLEQVAEATRRASTGCGGCRTDVESLLADARAAGASRSPLLAPALAPQPQPPRHGLPPAHAAHPHRDPVAGQAGAARQLHHDRAPARPERAGAAVGAPARGAWRAP